MKVSLCFSLGHVNIYCHVKKNALIDVNTIHFVVMDVVPSCFINSQPHVKQNKIVCIVRVIYYLLELYNVSIIIICNMNPSFYSLNSSFIKYLWRVDQILSFN